MAEAAGELGLLRAPPLAPARDLRAADPAGLVHGNRGRSSPRASTRGPGPRRGAAADPLRASSTTATHRAARGARGHRPQPRDGRGASCVPRASPARAGAGRRAHRSRRERMAAEGLAAPARRQPARLARGPRPWLSLLGAIDDATGTVPAARLPGPGGRRRLPRGARAPSSPPRASRGPSTATATAPSSRPGGARAPRTERPTRRRLSQVGRALAELGIGSIAARCTPGEGPHRAAVGHVPGPARGRAAPGGHRRPGRRERLPAPPSWPATTERFAVPAADPVPAWRPVPPGLRPRAGPRLQVPAQGGRDHTIRLDGRVLQLPRWGAGAGYAGKRVEVHVRLDGSSVAFDGRELVTRVAPSPAALRPASLACRPARTGARARPPRLLL